MSIHDFDRAVRRTHVVRQPVVIVSAMIFIIMSSDLVSSVSAWCGGSECVLTA